MGSVGLSSANLPCAKCSGCLQDVENNWKKYSFKAKKWSQSLLRGSDYRDLTGESDCVLPDTLGGRIWEVVAHVGSTVLTTTFDQQRFIKKPINKNVISVKRRCETACMITACTDLQRNCRLCQKGQTPAEGDISRKDHTDTIFTCEYT